MKGNLKKIATSLTLAFTLAAGGVVSIGAQIDASVTAVKSDAAQSIPDVGQQMKDGSVFAGLTPDGKQEIFAMPKDLSVTMTFNDAAQRVTQLNADKALGHDDWQIPSLENLRVLYKNQNEGALKGTFTTKASRASDSTDWYCSSTEYLGYPGTMDIVHFSDGGENWAIKVDLQLSCRPVRLVNVPHQ